MKLGQTRTNNLVVQSWQKSRVCLKSTGTGLDKKIDIHSSKNTYITDQAGILPK